MRITKRELFERLCGGIKDDLREPRFWLMAEQGDCDITVTVALFRKDGEGGMCAEVMENYYHDRRGQLGWRKLLFYLAFEEMDADYVSLQKICIEGEEVDLRNRKTVADALDQFRAARGDVEADKRPSFVTPSEKAKSLNVLDEPAGIRIGGGAGKGGVIYTP